MSTIKSQILVETLRAWRTIEVFSKHGILLEESFALVEKQCLLSELKPRFLELLLRVQQYNGEPPPDDFLEDYFLVSSKELFAEGWATGRIESSLRDSQNLICALLNAEGGKNINSENRASFLSFYFLNLWGHFLPMSVVFNCIKSDLIFLDLESSIDPLSKAAKEGLPLTPFLNSEDKLFVPELIDAIKKDEETGEMNIPIKELLSLPEIQLWGNQSVLKPSSANSFKVKFYHQLALEFAQQKAFREAFDVALGELSESDFKRLWTQLSQDILAATDGGRVCIDQSALSEEEKYLFNAGLWGGTLDQTLLDLAKIL